MSTDRAGRVSDRAAAVREAAAALAAHRLSWRAAAATDTSAGLPLADTPEALRRFAQERPGTLVLAGLAGGAAAAWLGPRVWAPLALVGAPLLRWQGRRWLARGLRRLVARHMGSALQGAAAPGAADR